MHVFFFYLESTLSDLYFIKDITIGHQVENEIKTNFVKVISAQNKNMIYHKIRKL